VHNREGFTIIEMLAVMAIISMLAAALGVAVWKMHEQMAIRSMRAEMTSVLSAMDEYREDRGGYPPRDIPTSNRTGGLVEALYEYYDCTMTLSASMYWMDPWQKEVIYIGGEDGSPVLISSGPDQEPGTNDDIIER
jgi:prepilin-type N-terminal cleavage/methylation domain-containing protein